MGRILSPKWGQCKNPKSSIAKRPVIFNVFIMGKAEKSQRFRPLDWLAVGRRLTIIREAKGMTQAEFARRLDVPKSSWGRWEKGERLIDTSYADRLYQSQGVDLHYIYWGRETNLPPFMLKYLAELLKSA